MKKPSIPLPKTMVAYWDCKQQLLVVFKQFTLLKKKPLTGKNKRSNILPSFFDHFFNKMILFHCVNGKIKHQLIRKSMNQFFIF